MHLLKVSLINLPVSSVFNTLLQRLCCQHQLSATEQGLYDLQVQYVDIQPFFTVFSFLSRRSLLTTVWRWNASLQTFIWRMFCST